MVKDVVDEVPHLGGMDIVEDEVEAQVDYGSDPPRKKRTIGETVSLVKDKVTTREGLVGDYDYATLCMPRIPFLQKTKSKPIFFGLNDPLPIFVGLLMGLQHALAMVAGVMTVPRILSGAGSGHLNLLPEQQAYLVSAALIIAGLMSVVQIVRIRLVKGYFMGTGLISMSGTSFTFLPIAEAAIRGMYDSGFCETIDGVPQPCPAAYGRWLGTVMVGAFMEIGLSFMPQKTMRKVFPPMVTGTTVFLIGASLLGVGLKYWAGGAGPCMDAATDFFAECPNIAAAKSYPWGDAHWIGLGFFVFMMVILVEIFGSPFMRNTQIIIGLVAGIILAAATGFIRSEFIAQAPWFTFLWVETFPLGFYAPALLPVLIGYVVSTLETVGDITASCDSSRVETEGPIFESRVQGGLLADGVNSLIAALMTGSPTTTFSQNNAVIAMTRTANKSAGLFAAGWLILFGVVGKVGGLFIAIPDAVLGGMTTFLFASILVSGMRILADLKWDRRERFILSASLALGLGVTIVPGAFASFIPETSNSGLNALRQAAVILLTSGMAIGSIMASVLNLIIPYESDEETTDEAADCATGSTDVVEHLEQDGHKEAAFAGEEPTEVLESISISDE